MNQQAENALFRAVGGVPLTQAGGDPNNPADQVWNFGLAAQPTPNSRPTLTQEAPHLLDVWDGKSNVCLWQNEVKLLGKVLPAQRQTRGTCTSRGTSAAANRRQIAQIVTGLRSDKFTPVSHSFLYGAGKKRGNDLNSRDGAVGDWLYRAMEQDGLATQVEAGDEYEGSDTDVLAVKWGTYGPPQNLYDLAADNKCDTVKCGSFLEAANAHAAGHFVVVCSDQGFSTTRDADGFCRAQGTWYHCMHFIGVFVTRRGRRGLVCAQSWGEDVPDGPRVLDQPSYTFAVEEPVADRMLRQGDSAIVATVNGWPNLAPRTPWVF